MKHNKLFTTTLAMGNDGNYMPAWILPIGSLMTNPEVKSNPSINEIILEARGLLAFKYDWRGRQLDVAEVLSSSGTRRSAAEVLEEWDEYNLFRFNLHLQEYTEVDY